jgi:hypothetical protein
MMEMPKQSAAKMIAAYEAASHAEREKMAADNNFMRAVRIIQESGGKPQSEAEKRAFLTDALSVFGYDIDPKEPIRTWMLEALLKIKNLPGWQKMDDKQIALKTGVLQTKILKVSKRFGLKIRPFRNELSKKKQQSMKHNTPERNALKAKLESMGYKTDCRTSVKTLEILVALYGLKDRDKMDLAKVVRKTKEVCKRPVVDIKNAIRHHDISYLRNEITMDSAALKYAEAFGTAPKKMYSKTAVWMERLALIGAERLAGMTLSEISKEIGYEKPGRRLFELLRSYKIGYKKTRL